MEIAEEKCPVVLLASKGLRWWMDSKTNERILNKVKKVYSSVKLDGRCTRNRPEMHLESGRRSPKAAARRRFLPRMMPHDDAPHYGMLRQPPPVYHLLLVWICPHLKRYFSLFQNIFVQIHNMMPHDDAPRYGMLRHLFIICSCSWFVPISDVICPYIKYYLFKFKIYILFTRFTIDGCIIG